MEGKKEAPAKSPQVAIPSCMDVEVPPNDPDVFDSNSSKYVSQNYRHAAGAGYALATGVCGIVLVALSSSLQDLAGEIDTSSLKIGAVFLTRGIGAAIGNLLCPRLYRLVRGKAAVSVTLFLLAGCLICIPLAGDVGTLHLNFFALGFLTAIIDSGCQLMTLRLHGSAAGPWLGANTVAFGVSGTISPLIGWLTGSLVVEYCTLGAVTFCIGFYLIVLPKPDVEPALNEEQIQAPSLKIPQGWSRPRAFYQTNKVDFLLCGLMFWFMGGRVAATAFLRQFAQETSGASNASLLIVILWLSITMGRIAGLRDQLTLTLTRLYRHTALVCLGGIISMILLLIFSRGVGALWATVVFYGLFNGPSLGYGYDLSTRVLPNSATGTLVATFGITAGASVVPFLASFTWYITGWAFFLPLFIAASHAVPYVLLQKVKRLHGPASNFRRRLGEEGDDASLSAPTPTFGAPPSPSAAWSSTGSHVDDEEEQERREAAGMANGARG